MTKRLTAIALLLATVRVVASDPSATPIRRADGQYDERYRVRVDLNGDDRPDLILSQGVSEMGNATGIAQVFLAQADDQYKSIGEVPFHSRGLVAVEPTKTGARIWSYAHVSSQSGVIGYNDVAGDALGTFHGLEISAGDAGTMIGNALVSAVFTAVPKPAVERSETSDAGVVWKRVD